MNRVTVIEHYVDHGNVRIIGNCFSATLEIITVTDDQGETGYQLNLLSVAGHSIDKRISKAWGQVEDFLNA